MYSEGCFLPCWLHDGKSEGSFRHLWWDLDRCPPGMYTQVVPVLLLTIWDLLTNAFDPCCCRLWSLLGLISIAILSPGRARWKGGKRNEAKRWLSVSLSYVRT